MADVHRGRIQAQGAGTEKSVAWSRDTPPTESEMLAFCDDLESQLTSGEKQSRSRCFAQLRRFIRAAAQFGGASAPITITWRNRAFKNIRVDLEIRTGKASVSD
jgi:hypothetical protein